MEGLRLRLAAIRPSGIELVQADARQRPYDLEFDVVGAFDVLEHIAEDLDALRQLVRAVKPGGGVLLTVPQHPALWSPIDEYSHHQRRYTRQGLIELLRLGGLQSNASPRSCRCCSPR